MISVALFDLKCPSYDYVKRMPWAEFLIRLHGLKREREVEMLKLRELAWVTYIAPHQDPKKMKKNKESFWPVGKKKPQVSEAVIERMKQATKEYLDKKKQNGKG